MASHPILQVGYINRRPIAPIPSVHLAKLIPLHPFAILARACLTHLYPVSAPPRACCAALRPSPSPGPRRPSQLMVVVYALPHACLYGKEVVWIGPHVRSISPDAAYYYLSWGPNHQPGRRGAHMGLAPPQAPEP